MSVQKQATALNGISGKSQTVYTGGAINLSNDSGVEMNHNHGIHHSKNGGNSYNGALDGDTTIIGYDYTEYVNLRHRHKLTFTPSLQSSDTETRPINYTQIVWKRIK